jgi:hypothetical protein
MTGGLNTKKDSFGIWSLSALLILEHKKEIPYAFTEKKKGFSMTSPK